MREVISMFKFSGLVSVKFTEPIDMYIKKTKDTIEIIQISANDACTEVLIQNAELEALPDYIRCSVIHDFGRTADEPKSVQIEIAETLVLIAGDVCNLSELPEVYTVDPEV
jgi:hypothetical protein